MYKKKKTMIDEEEEILQKAKYILSVEEYSQNSNDKVFIQYIKAIFTKEFEQTSLSLPVKKKDKEPFQYLKNFVNILFLLFKENEIERSRLYKSEISPKVLGNDLFNKVQNLSTLISRKKMSGYDSGNLYEKVNCIFCKNLKDLSNTLEGCLNLYFYYLQLFIKSVKPFRLLLYYFLPVNELFKNFDYSDFCPDLNSNNCLNLIILFLKNIANKQMEILSIYSFLIFRYQCVFKNIEDNIDVAILENAVKQTVYINKEKASINRVNVEDIINEFIKILKNNIIFPSKKISEINDNDEESKTGDYEESMHSNKTIESNNNKNENIEDGNKKEVFNDKENKSTNKKESSSPSIQIINEQNDNSFLDIRKDNTIIDKNDKNKKEKNDTEKFDSELFKSPEMQYLFKELNNLKNKNYKMEEEQNELKKKYNEIQIEVQNGNRKISQLQKKLEEITEILGNIQMRDRAKNVLNHYQYLLDDKDYEIIQKDKNKKWEIISNKIEIKYKKFEKSQNYKTFIEIVKKCVGTIKKGNDDAHHVNLEYYENNINKIAIDNNIEVKNPIKMCFLIQIKVSKNLLVSGYNLLDKFYENDMTRAFTKGASFEEFFN